MMTNGTQIIQESIIGPGRILKIFYVGPMFATKMEVIDEVIVHQRSIAIVVENGVQLSFASIVDPEVVAVDTMFLR